MRTLPIFITLFLTGIIFFASCHNHSDLSARETAEKFMTAVQFGDFKEARLYASDETAELLKFQNPAMKRPFQDGFEVIREEVDGDYAKVFYTEEGEEDEKFIRMKKSGKGWLVIMSKSELRPGNIFDELNDGLKDSNDDWDEDSGGLRSISDEAKDEAKEIANSFLSALEAGDVKGAMEHADMGSDEWLFIHGDSEEYTSRWAQGISVTGHLFMGSRAKILYKIGEEEPTYELKLVDKSGIWFVTDFEGPEEWEGAGEELGGVVKSMEEVTETMGKQMEKSMEKAFENAFK